MIRRTLRCAALALLLGSWVPRLAAQQSATEAPAAASPKLEPRPAGDPRPLIDALNPGDLQEAINLLRANYIKPGDVDDRALTRATLSGLLAHLGHGAMLLPGKSAPAASHEELPPDAYYSEVLSDHSVYIRLGALSRPHLDELDKTLKGFGDHAPAAIVLDLRATPPSSDFDLAADVIRRFVAKGKPLFTLKKPSNNQERLFTSNADPSFAGLIMLLVDRDTAGAPEAIAAVIRYYDRSLVVGEPTAGQAVEYADLGLSGGAVLRVAVSQVFLPANLSIFPDGVKPDLLVQVPRAETVAVLKEGAEKGMQPLIDEMDRPHLNEAALINRTNPELDAALDAQEARRRGAPAPKAPLHDMVLQRAVGLIATISVFETKAQ